MQDTRSERPIPVPPPMGGRGHSGYPTVPPSPAPYYDQNGPGPMMNAGIASRPRVKDPARVSRSHASKPVQMPVPSIPTTAMPAAEPRHKGHRLRVKVGHPEYEVIINRDGHPQQQQPFPHFVNQGTSKPLVNPGFIDPNLLVPGQQQPHTSGERHHQHHSSHDQHRHHRSRTASHSQPTGHERARTHSHGRERTRAHSHSRVQQPASQHHQSRSRSREHQRPRTTSSSRYIDHVSHVQHSPLPSPGAQAQQSRGPPPQYLEIPANPMHMRLQTLPGGHVLDQMYQYSNCTGRRRALFIGINYKDQPNELQGCVNDAKNVCKFMMQRYNYRAEDIVLLTDDSSHERQQPTRKNMMDAMRWLVRGAKCHDSLFFHYSGHGGQTRDLDGDEIDGYDEVIFPVDYLAAGHIIDDDLNKILVKRLPRGCRLTAVFDSCHSGTALDLDYAYHSNGRLRGHQVTAKARASKATDADVISFCACKDDQTSADSTEQGVAVGAMSYAFMLSLPIEDRNPNQSYRSLLKDIRAILSKKYSQKCQLSSSHPIDTNLRFIM